MTTEGVSARGGRLPYLVKLLYVISINQSIQFKVCSFYTFGSCKVLEPKMNTLHLLQKAHPDTTTIPAAATPIASGWAGHPVIDRQAHI